ncbi:MAG: hypothetical protein WAR79_18645 [Melioribacteraceae bacterium]
MRTVRIIPIIIILFFSCDKGLSPNLAELKVGFGGSITFIGNWNPEVNQTHVVLFKDPLLSVEDFNVFNLKFVSDTIPTGSQIHNYSTNDNSLIANIEPGEYSYLAVAQSKLNYLTLNREDWFIVGVYYINNDFSNLAKLIIPEAAYVENVNIICDFNNPPPQPPGGLNNLLKIYFESQNNKVAK